MIMVSACHSPAHASEILEQIFERCFLATENTRLIGGAEEPLYLPSADGQPQHRLYYREDYFASALHEVSHWCIAGQERRAQRDFGYWYEPEGRDAETQTAFLQAEARPQAVECYLSLACGYRFQLSLDSFDPENYGAMRNAFAARVAAEASNIRQRGLPPRAALLFDALACEYATGLSSRSLPVVSMEQLL